MQTDLFHQTLHHTYARRLFVFCWRVAGLKRKKNDLSFLEKYLSMSSKMWIARPKPSTRPHSISISLFWHWDGRWKMGKSVQNETEWDKCIVLRLVLNIISRPKSLFSSAWVNLKKHLSFQKHTAMLVNVGEKRQHYIFLKLWGQGRKTSASKLCFHSKTKGGRRAASSALLSPASWTLKQITECSPQVWAHWQYNYWTFAPSPFLSFPNPLRASTTQTFHQNLRAHLDGHAAGCPANQGVCAPRCSQCDVESVNRNNESSAACDPQLMLHPLPGSLSNSSVSGPERLFPTTTRLAASLSCLIANGVALEDTSCPGSPVNRYIIEVKG